MNSDGLCPKLLVNQKGEEPIIHEQFHCFQPTMLRSTRRESGMINVPVLYRDPPSVVGWNSNQFSMGPSTNVSWDPKQSPRMAILQATHVEITKLQHGQDQWCQTGCVKFLPCPPLLDWNLTLVEPFFKLKAGSLCLIEHLLKECQGN